MIEDELARAEAKSRRTGQPERRLKELHVDNAHDLEPAAPGRGPKPSGPRVRPIRASWSPHCGATPTRPGRVYEKIYCARGEMENRIKECQLDLYADRTSAATMRANQLRLWFHSMAYVLLCALRRIGLRGIPRSPMRPAAQSVSS